MQLFWNTAPPSSYEERRCCRSVTLELDMQIPTPTTHVFAVGPRSYTYDAVFEGSNSYGTRRYAWPTEEEAEAKAAAFVEEFKRIATLMETGEMRPDYILRVMKDASGKTLFTINDRRHHTDNC